MCQVNNRGTFAVQCGCKYSKNFFQTIGDVIFFTHRTIFYSKIKIPAYSINM